jgi:MerR family transcriptional regulator, repressor of the yfmOP operon
MSQQNTPQGQLLQIGEAADRAGVTQRTLRYYEEKGLLNAPARLDGGFRLYSTEDIDRIARIKEMRDLLGFSLADIKEMLDADDVRLQIKAEWRSDADEAEKAQKIGKAREATLAQMRLIDQKMQQMTAMRDELVTRRGSSARGFRVGKRPAHRAN